MHYCLKEIDVVILCGGQGKRLRPAVSDRPKVLAPINDRTFLDIQIDNLSSFGFNRIILSTGYQKDKIKRHFAGKVKPGPYVILFSEEEFPLGTGGAVKNARGFIESNPFFVINGDSFCKIDLKNFLDFHISRKALVSMVVTASKHQGEGGAVKLNSNGKISGFYEKYKKAGADYINAGIYLFDQNIFSYIPEKKFFSLERDLFPFVQKGKFYGYISNSRFIDIGTPERYNQAKKRMNG